MQREIDQVNEKLKASTETCKLYNNQLPNKKKKIQDLSLEITRAGEEERRAGPLREEKAEAVSVSKLSFSLLGAHCK